MGQIGNQFSSELTSTHRSPESQWRDEPHRAMTRALVTPRFSNFFRCVLFFTIVNHETEENERGERRTEEEKPKNPFSLQLERRRSECHNYSAPFIIQFGLGL
jgi:hypothetical protein